MRILLAEDSALLRAGLAELLRAAGHDVHDVADADALERECDTVDPDLVVTDVRMPPGMGEDGLVAVHRLREARARAGRAPLPVVVLSQYVAAAYLDVLMEHGGFGYLLKERVGDVTEFLRAVRDVADGGTVVDPEVVRVLMRSRTTGVGALTDREREVLELMARGLGNPEIERHLHLSAGAVSKHVANIFMKLGFTPEDGNRRVRAVLEWLRHRPL